MNELDFEKNGPVRVGNAKGTFVRSEILREVIASLPQPTLLLDAAGVCGIANDAASRLFAASDGELEGLDVASLIPEAPFVDRSSSRGRAIDVASAAYASVPARRRDGAELFLEVRTCPLDTDQGVRLVVALCDATRQVNAEREVVRLATDLRERLEDLGEALRAKDLLLREIHHRVKNNLQIVSSMLSLQSRRVRDDDARRLFEDSCERLVSMSLVHEQLYRGSDLGHVDFASYLRSLVVGIARGHVSDVHGVDIAVRARPMSLPVDYAVPAGLIVHELVSNALKHAFPDGGPGSIVVSLETLEDGRHEITVEDDGVGVASTERVDAVPTFGTRLVALLVRQMDAEIEVTSERGTCTRIRFRDRSEEDVS